MRFTRLARLCSLLLIVDLLLLQMPLGAQPPMDAASVKAAVEARGVGGGVKVVEVDKTRITGIIASIGEQSFVLKQTNGQPPADIAFAQVRDVRNNSGMSRGAKIGLWVGITAAAAGITAVILVAKFRSGFPKTV
jgi:hypothetical protein